MDEGSSTYYISNMPLFSPTDVYVEGIMCLVSSLYTGHFSLTETIYCIYVTGRLLYVRTQVIVAVQYYSSWEFPMLMLLQICLHLS